MCISPEQERKKEEARHQAIECTYNVDATGEKKELKRWDDFSNQIDND